MSILSPSIRRAHGGADMQRRNFIAATAAGIGLTASGFATLESTMPRTGYAPVNGLKFYYEVHGSGQPLVLLHGGLGASGMFAAILPRLSARRQVIAADLQAHGRTVDIDRPLSFVAMASDIAGLLKHLGIARADVMGYS